MPDQIKCSWNFSPVSPRMSLRFRGAVSKMRLAVEKETSFVVSVSLSRREYEPKKPLPVWSRSLQIYVAWSVFAAKLWDPQRSRAQLNGQLFIAVKKHVSGSRALLFVVTPFILLMPPLLHIFFQVAKDLFHHLKWWEMTCISGRMSCEY